MTFSPYLFEIKTLTQNFATWWLCKWFHCVAHGHFTIPRQHFYGCGSFRLEIIFKLIKKSENFDEDSDEISKSHLEVLRKKEKLKKERKIEEKEFELTQL